MPSSQPLESRHIPRRAVLGAGAMGISLAFASLRSWAAQDSGAEALLRKGGVVAAFRHSLAPGTFDPPGFRLGDCSTQRNLSEDGRAQARAVGAWFKQRQLQPDKVLSSPWCRCVDSATLAFGTAETWPALGSPRGSPETTSADHLRELRTALTAATSKAGRFEVWFTHMFVLSDLANTNTSSGEALILRADRSGKTEVLARLAVSA
ncbi:MAG: histidine phosphatase family protein [Gammaproteobacteria bacterium]|nr:histidine phosphatase family protein [Gammaproteobacteria bacterium]MBU1508147.1 histidine phosphatase family protein [Gammaproteobacteria bacterium]MBU2120710.1 histidine phosphatase family protein [Gammaproteobacteria bacterium]MBU2169453.1 histidine phosphatase family protein [Gammaproteobacteria bacterium]MBU2200467.1 histidine phosphatase family protein [Gammaproteobacteria bacterium]